LVHGSIVQPNFPDVLQMDTESVHNFPEQKASIPHVLMDCKIYPYPQ